MPHVYLSSGSRVFNGCQVRRLRTLEGSLSGSFTSLSSILTDQSGKVLARLPLNKRKYNVALSVQTMLEKYQFVYGALCSLLFNKDSRSLRSINYSEVGRALCDPTESKMGLSQRTIRRYYLL